MRPDLNMQRFYSPQLDGLRFLAALAVFIHHVPPIPGFGAFKFYGWIGVDIFLTISAYLITRLILVEAAAKGTFSLKNFYIRRALRIWPLYFGYITVMCLLTLALDRSSFSNVAAWWLSHVSFTGNVLTAIKGYENQPIFTSHLWTISLEEQAYIVLPLALSVFVIKKPVLRNVTIAALGVLIVLAIARLAFLMAGTPHPFIWVMPLRGDAFVLGSLAAIALHRNALIPRAWMMILGLAFMSFSGLFPSNEEPGLYQVFGYTVVALGAVAFVVGSQAAGVARSPLASPVFRYLGKISYGLYVYHVLAIDLVFGRAHAWGVPEPVATAVAFVATVGIAAVSYAVFEKPFLRWKSRFEAVPTRPV